MSRNREKQIPLDDLGKQVVIRKWAHPKFFTVTEAAAELGTKLVDQLFDTVRVGPEGASEYRFKRDPKQLAQALMRAGEAGVAFVEKVVRMSLANPTDLTEEELKDLTIEDLSFLLAEVLDQNFSEGVGKNLRRLQGKMPAPIRRLLEDRKAEPKEPASTVTPSAA